MPRRPMPVGFEADAMLPHRILYEKYHCRGEQVIRWRNELGLPNSAQSKPVIQLDLDGNEIARFHSIHAAAKAVGGNANNITVCLQGKIATAYGYKWRLVNAD